MVETEIVDAARQIADAFERHGVPYALGGALAYGYWGPARATKDVDWNVFAGVSGVPQAVAALTEAGVAIDEEEATTAAREGGYARGWVGPIAIDIFFNSIPLHDAAASRTSTQLLAGRPVKVLSAEDLCVLKLLFNRGKDIVDVEHLVALRRRELDRAYVRQWLVDSVGEDDHRVARWDELCKALPPEDTSDPQE